MEASEAIALSRALLRANRPAEAVDVLWSAIEKSPNSAALHFEFGQTALERGRKGEAEAALNAAAALDPKSSEIPLALAELALRSDRPAEALRYARRAEEIAPGPAATVRVALALVGLERWSDAELKLTRLLKARPSDAQVPAGLARVRLHQDRAQEARSLVLAALRVQPRRAQHHVLLGQCLLALQQAVLALQAFRVARQIDPGNADAAALYDRALSRLGGVEAAKSALEAAVKSTPLPAQLPALSILGEFLEANGYADDAVDVLRTIVQRSAGNVDALTSLARIRRFEHRDDPDLHSIEAALSTATSPGELQALGFALGKGLDDLGDNAAALARYVEANRIRRAQVEFSLERERNTFSAIAEAFNADFIKRHSDVTDKGVVPRPIFVIGMPRSGTTLVEQILAGADDVYAGGELPYLRLAAEQVVMADPILRAARFVGSATPSTWGDIARHYRGQLSPLARSKSVVTDKLPHNFQLVGLISLAFPEAAIVHVSRNPMDNCLSMFRANFLASGMAFTFDQAELGQYYNLYRRLMEHWRRVLPGRMYELTYEDLVATPEATTQSLFAHCELRWTPSILDFHRRRSEVRTASLVQVRRPLHRNSVDRAARYGPGLEPLRAALSHDGAT